jgi:hypothetical protein
MPRMHDADPRRTFPAARHPTQEIFAKSQEAGNVVIDLDGPYRAVAGVVEGDVFQSIGRFPVTARRARSALALWREHQAFLGRRVSVSVTRGQHPCCPAGQTPRADAAAWLARQLLNGRWLACMPPSSSLPHRGLTPSLSQRVCAALRQHGPVPAPPGPSPRWPLVRRCCALSFSLSLLCFVGAPISYSEHGAAVETLPRFLTAPPLPLPPSCPGPSHPTWQACLSQRACWTFSPTSSSGPGG